MISYGMAIPKIFIPPNYGLILKAGLLHKLKNMVQTLEGVNSKKGVAHSLFMDGILQ
jgi:hypothetical protein